ncbi:hypothetical protein WJX74_000492 [Apatococcus lobatus]|uniref:Uncharacterized protein n=1 Tax=Apatococcus lobatus TaxID=904363 RepID=A0AAW1QTZ8_9CHLO
MRKCSSAPDLVVLSERNTSASHSHQPRTSGLRSASSQQTSRFRSRCQEVLNKPQGPEAGNKLGSSLNRRSCTVQSPKAAQALFGWEPPTFSPDFLREADEIAAVSNLKGITAAECFEIYGVPEDAPATTDSTSGNHRDRSSDEEGLASCLATPSTMTEETSLGETMDEHLRRYNAEQSRQVQARFDGELKTNRDAEIGNTNAKLPSKRSTNRRRKSLQDLFSSSFGDDEPPAGRPQSPDGHAYLSSLHGTMDDDRNRLALPEGSAGLEEFRRPAFLVPGQEPDHGSLHHVEAYPAQIQAPITQPPSSPSAMAAYYDSLNEFSQAQSSYQSLNLSPTNGPTVMSHGSDLAHPSGATAMKSDVKHQPSALPQKSSPNDPAAPHDDSAGPDQAPRTADPDPQQEPRPDHPKPQQRNNIVPLPFKVRDKHA